MLNGTAVARRILWGAGTPRTMRAHWILQEVGLEYERRPIGSRTGETQTDEFTRINPSQKIPVLQDGEFDAYGKRRHRHIRKGTERYPTWLVTAPRYENPGQLLPMVFFSDDGVRR